MLIGELRVCVELTLSIRDYNADSLGGFLSQHRRLVVLGGAGYIGSIFCAQALTAGYEVIVYDNFSTGNTWAIPKRAILVEGDIRDLSAMKSVMVGADAVVHFAAKSEVAESVIHPELYFDNNVGGTEIVLKAMGFAGVRTLIFSSTAAVYGAPSCPDKQLLDESFSCDPINPYGLSKLRAENLIQEWAQSDGNTAIIFRYFNAAGACLRSLLGELHDPETHLIPNVIKAALTDGLRQVHIFGDNYDTPDGTCVRDYIHVTDIAIAHLKGLQKKWMNQSGSIVYNLGNACGISVMQVVHEVEKVAQKRVKYVISDRRQGDPEMLVASSEKIRRDLGWVPEQSDLNRIIETAYRWHKFYDAKYPREN